jgi:short subunit dehydrogenase-like uncharacterized protein
MNFDGASWMIYGANGFSGRRIAELAKSRGHRPVLAGRNRKEIEELAQKLELPAAVISLEEQEKILDALKGIDILLNCAGPFSKTALPLAEACMKAKTNYLDISGEWQVFENLFQMEEIIKSAAICVVPGVGFDVVPTDYAANKLKDQLPDATHLKIVFSYPGRMSPGTRRTVFEGLKLGNYVRKDGQMKQIGLGTGIELGEESETLLLTFIIPWGDLSTAYKSTGIPNIEIKYCLQVPGFIPKITLNLLYKSLGSRAFQWMGEKMLPLILPQHRTQNDRTTAKTKIAASVRNSAGDCVTTHFEMEDVYEFTDRCAVSAVEKLQNSSSSMFGVYTPTQFFGCDFFESLCPKIRLSFHAKTVGETPKIQS